MTYREKLRDPRWQKKRLEILQASSWKCQLCGNGSITLEVHHLYYKNGTDPWDYPNTALLCCCEICHDQIHAAIPKCEGCTRLEKALADTEKMWREERIKVRELEERLTTKRRPIQRKRGEQKPQQRKLGG